MQSLKEEMAADKAASAAREAATNKRLKELETGLPEINYWVQMMRTLHPSCDPPTQSGSSNNDIDDLNLNL